MEILTKILAIHEELIPFSIEMQTKSSAKMTEGKHIGPNVYNVFFKIMAYAVTLHRAILSLCESGWTHITPILLRTIMECSGNCLAIVNNEDPEYMAFKYLYHPYIQLWQDEEYPLGKREKAKIDIEKGLEGLEDEARRKRAKEYCDSRKIGIYWFQPEERGPSDIIKKYGSYELKFVYGVYSMTAHAGHFGIFGYKDNSDDIGIDASKNPEKTKSALISSSRLLLELLYIRNYYEKLGLDIWYKKILAEILETEKGVRGSWGPEGIASR